MIFHCFAYRFKRLLFCFIEKQALDCCNILCTIDVIKRTDPLIQIVWGTVRYSYNFSKIRGNTLIPVYSFQAKVQTFKRLNDEMKSKKNPEKIMIYSWLNIISYTCKRGKLFITLNPRGFFAWKSCENLAKIKQTLDSTISNVSPNVCFDGFFY